MSLTVKICGLSTPEALDVALDAGADMVGFVFFPPSPRNLSFKTAAALELRVRGRAKKVALSVDADDTLLSYVVDALGPDILQLHGNESPLRVAAIKARFRLPVMKAIPVESKGDLAAIARYAAVADWLLFDARPPREATRPGGLGKAVRLASFGKHRCPACRICCRAGSMPTMSARRLRITRAPGVDVSSGVERAPGEKDPEKIRAFVRRRAGGGKQTRVHPVA